VFVDDAVKRTIPLAMSRAFFRFWPPHWHFSKVAREIPTKAGPYWTMGGRETNPKAEDFRAADEELARLLRQEMRSASAVDT